ncbi:MAG TPA: rhodanese-like domain-containing protein [Pyrinomonadaceae bacterium]|jgi:3-mercaptopyruvate sulfurtransferase SseA
MRLFVSMSAVIILGLMVLAGCNSQDKRTESANVTTTRATNTTTAAQQPPKVTVTPPSDGARRITVAELEEALKKGGATVIDVRNDASFKQAHIKGAILIPVNEVGNRASEIPRDKLIVTYCS